MSWLIWLEVILLLLVIVVLLATIYTFLFSITNPPFVPTANPKVVKKVREFLEKNPEIECFIEPGCGIGNVSRAIQADFPNIVVFSIEYNFVIYLLAKTVNFFSKTKINLIWGNVLRLDLVKLHQNRPTLIYCYLLPELMEAAVRKDIFKNCWLISLDFAIKSLKALETIELNQKGVQKTLWIYSL